MKTWWRGIIAIGGLLVASTANAQVVDDRGNPYRRWDIAVGGTLHFDREVDRRRPVEFYGNDWDGGVAVQVDAGRYWNSHLKTEASFAAITGRSEYQSEQIPVPGGFASAPLNTEVARKQFAAAITYQFLENVFAHPYVSAGVRATFHDRHTVRLPFAYLPFAGSGGSTIPLPPREWRDQDTFARPYVAAGFKSYFNERTFIRSELSTAYADFGVSQWTIRLGFGVDF